MQQVTTEKKEASITNCLTIEIFQLVMTNKERKKNRTLEGVERKISRWAISKIGQRVFCIYFEFD